MYFHLVQEVVERIGVGTSCFGDSADLRAPREHEGIPLPMLYSVLSTRVFGDRRPGMFVDELCEFMDGVRQVSGGEVLYDTARCSEGIWVDLADNEAWACCVIGSQPVADEIVDAVTWIRWPCGGQVPLRGWGQRVGAEVYRAGVYCWSNNPVRPCWHLLGSLEQGHPLRLSPGTLWGP